MARDRGGLSPADPAYAGQKEYTPGFLRAYDPLVLGLYCRFVWRCPASRLLAHYGRHLRRRHLDVGPGTGYFLRRTPLPAGAELTLLDPNPNVLAHAGRRLRAATLVQADVCKPLPLPGRPFDSVALNLVLHCLPASCKHRAVRHVADVLGSDGVLFGASVLGEADRRTRLSRRALAALNRRGTFDNLGDTEAGLRAMLASAFQTVEVEVHGAVAVFSASGVRR